MKKKLKLLQKKLPSKLLCAVSGDFRASIFKIFWGSMPLDLPSRLKKFFSALHRDQNFFGFNKTRSNFGLDPRLDLEKKPTITQEEEKLL